MKKILFVLVVSAFATAITALAEHGANCPCCSKAKAGDKAAGCSTNAPACTNAPVADQPVK
jgi:hypothetical protein